MPLHFPSLTRREFLQRSVVGGLGLLTIRAFCDPARPADADYWILCADTHVAGDPATIARGVNVADRLRATVAAAGSLPVQPAGVFIDGDCALDHGLAGDYATFAELLHPLREAGLPIHLTLGNHDDREVFWNALAGTRPSVPAVASKHVSIIETGHANWFLLDSLEITKATPGRLGDEQRAWLARVLDDRRGKPALIMVHHNLLLADSEKKTGLLDSAELLELVQPRRHVMAIFYGHTHTWRLNQVEGLHLVNLPAVGYPFQPAEVTGWTECRLREDGMSLQVHAHDPGHPEHGKSHELTWRDLR